MSAPSSRHRRGHHAHRRSKAVSLDWSHIRLHEAGAEGSVLQDLEAPAQCNTAAASPPGGRKSPSLTFSAETGSTESIRIPSASSYGSANLIVAASAPAAESACASGQEGAMHFDAASTRPPPSAKQKAVSFVDSHSVIPDSVVTGHSGWIDVKEFASNRMREEPAEAYVFRGRNVPASPIKAKSLLTAGLEEGDVDGLRRRGDKRHSGKEETRRADDNDVDDDAVDNADDDDDDDDDDGRDEDGRDGDVENDTDAEDFSQLRSHRRDDSDLLRADGPFRGLEFNPSFRTVLRSPRREATLAAGGLGGSPPTINIPRLMDYDLPKHEFRSQSTQEPGTPSMGPRKRAATPKSVGAVPLGTETNGADSGFGSPSRRLSFFSHRKSRSMAAPESPDARRTGSPVRDRTGHSRSLSQGLAVLASPFMSPSASASAPSRPDASPERKKMSPIRSFLQKVPLSPRKALGPRSSQADEDVPMQDALDAPAQIPSPVRAAHARTNSAPPELRGLGLSFSTLAGLRKRKPLQHDDTTGLDVKKLNSHTDDGLLRQSSGSSQNQGRHRRSLSALLRSSTKTATTAGPSMATARRRRNSVAVVAERENVPDDSFGNMMSSQANSYQSQLIGIGEEAEVETFEPKSHHPRLEQLLSPASTTGPSPELNSEPPLFGEPGPMFMSRSPYSSQEVTDLALGHGPGPLSFAPGETPDTDAWEQNPRADEPPRSPWKSISGLFRRNSLR